MVNFNFLIAFAIVFLAICIYAGVVIYLWNNHRKETNRLLEYQINISTELTDSMPELIDRIVQETFKEYSLLNLEYKQDYINEEQEGNILKEVSTLVSNRISPALLSKFSLYYNLDHISDIIGNKIYLTVMGYVMDKNSIKSDRSQLG